MSFAKIIKKIRKELGLTQNELASKLKVTRQALSMWESGERTPKLDDIISIVKILDITIEITKDSIIVKGHLKAKK